MPSHTCDRADLASERDAEGPLLRVLAALERLEEQARITNHHLAETNHLLQMLLEMDRAEMLARRLAGN